MKLVILAGGRGTRISEESQLRPKPMIEIGGRPIIWHIMKSYSFHGIRDFIVCCGYKGEMIKDYFVHYYMRQSDSTYHLSEHTSDLREIRTEPWRVTLANTGLNTLTAGRLSKVSEYIDGEDFMLTYGDGVSDVAITKVLSYHKSHGKLVTITTTRPPGRFGALAIDEPTGQVLSFREKARMDQAFVNAGFMVMKREVFNYIGSEDEMLESGPLTRIAEDGQLMAYRHDGFWSPMDTINDMNYLNSLWNSGKAPWKVW